MEENLTPIYNTSFVQPLKMIDIDQQIRQRNYSEMIYLLLRTMKKKQRTVALCGLE